MYIKSVKEKITSDDAYKNLATLVAILAPKPELRLKVVSIFNDGPDNQHPKTKGFPLLTAFYDMPTLDNRDVNWQLLMSEAKKFVNGHTKDEDYLESLRKFWYELNAETGIYEISDKNTL